MPPDHPAHTQDLTIPQHTIGKEIRGVITFIVVVWTVFLLDLFLPLEKLGLVPRTARGLPGLVTMPFLHSSLGHVLSNSVSLFILLMLLAGSRARSWQVMAAIILLGGALLWLFGRSAVHVGASGLVFGLISFLIASGILERRLLPLMASIIVGFLYGTTLLWGVLPTVPGVSWDGHLSGAIAGVVVAYGLTRDGGSDRKR